MTEYTLRIEAKAVEFIVYLMGQRPYAEVAPIIAEIKRQQAEQDAVAASVGAPSE